jgi:small subunit ribosomal protein S27Ae
MHILIRTLTGQSCTLNFASEPSVDSLKTEVENVMGVPSEEQKLIFNGKKLESGNVFDFGVEENSCVYLVVALEGGAKGKKKKKDTKKGKKKHKKKKVKLAILKYYKVEDGKVVRLRQMCKVCPPGTFIAEHADRLYCGRCHTAYTKAADAKGAKGGDKGKAAATTGKKK